MAAKTGPLSPHLQVYRPQLTSLLSITHRATGVFLALAALLLCYWLLCVAAGADRYAALMLQLGAWYGQAMLGAILFSVYFHLCNGIRHLFWDLGLGLSLRSTYASGYTVVACSVLLTVATFCAGAAR
jgi:succinate dehydrogenase / fumarate reductase cytochrome b subunit